MKVESHLLGTLIETDFVQVLLGNRNSQISQLQKSFPGVQFKRVKQVHGDKVTHTSPHTIDFSFEADAHSTSQANLGLCIATADCIPVMIYHHEPRWACAIHAGWRGVEKRIVPKAIASLIRSQCRPEDMLLFVGPHIQASSFEVGNDVRDKLLNSIRSPDDSLWVPSAQEGKSKVDLHQILKLQLEESGVRLENVFFELVDTVTDQGYHSFRRDKENSGRQLSFLSLKNA
jgi:YfiH family protein